MYFTSTQNIERAYSIDEAISLGLAPDGGLLVPLSFPKTFLESDAMALPALSLEILRPFFVGSKIEHSLDDICDRVFNFPTPVTSKRFNGANIQLLELFHGPTAAFKDYGARFLIACLHKLNHDNATALTILVATSGDTGGAVAAAVAETNLSACILFPKNGVSELQERQLCCWPDNILSLRIASDFDACQSIVKQAFNDTDLRHRKRLTSANSINVARLLAQMVYYWHASIGAKRERGADANFIVPTGNLGNALACVWARRMGAPIGKIHVAVNANQTLADFAVSGEYVPRPSVKTLSNAMDVGAPSNFERLSNLLGKATLSDEVISVSSHSDQETQDAILKFHQENDGFICPHTAVGMAALAGDAVGKGDDWIVAATAHPAKFNDIIEPIIGRGAEPPTTLSALHRAPISVQDEEADYVLVRERILKFS